MSVLPITHGRDAHATKKAESSKLLPGNGEKCRFRKEHSLALCLHVMRNRLAAALYCVNAYHEFQKKQIFIFNFFMGAAHFSARPPSTWYRDRQGARGQFPRRSNERWCHPSTITIHIPTNRTRDPALPYGRGTKLGGARQKSSENFCAKNDIKMVGRRYSMCSILLSLLYELT